MGAAITSLNEPHCKPHFPWTFFFSNHLFETNLCSLPHILFGGLIFSFWSLWIWLHTCSCAFGNNAFWYLWSSKTFMLVLYCANSLRLPHELKRNNVCWTFPQWWVLNWEGRKHPHWAALTRKQMIQVSNAVRLWINREIEILHSCERGRLTSLKGKGKGSCCHKCTGK